MPSVCLSFSHPTHAPGSDSVITYHTCGSGTQVFCIICQWSYLSQQRPSFAPQILGDIPGLTLVVSLLTPCFWVILGALPLEQGVAFADVPGSRSFHISSTFLGAAFSCGRWAQQYDLHSFFSSSIRLQVSLLSAGEQQIRRNHVLYQFHGDFLAYWQLGATSQGCRGPEGCAGHGSCRRRSLVISSCVSVLMWCMCHSILMCMETVMQVP